MSPSFSDPLLFEDYLLCGPKQISSSYKLSWNFLRVMGSINVKISNGNNWASSYVTSPFPGIFGLFQCQGDLSRSECIHCFNESREKLDSCLPAEYGRLYTDGCFLRFDTYNFLGEQVNPIFDRVECNGVKMHSPMEDSMDREFQSTLDQAFVNVTQRAPKNKGFGVAKVGGETVTVYTMAQCWRTLSENDCRDCLLQAKSGLRTCVPNSEGRALFTGCFLRYSTARFYDDVVEEFSDPFMSNRQIVIFISMAIAVSALTFFGAYIGYKRLSKKKEGLNGSVESSGHESKYSLNFEYETLDKATNHFKDSMKLGQGGAGSVFKGILPNGKTVAVKRLFFNTRQWVDQFFNEVNLISGIQHKNLVALMGCSIEGPESLLVYEYVPNRSLDQILFVKNTIHILSWRQRFNIIIGTAEGLAYLHGGCGAKIIHRDIKTSNILLDENLTPKIADFGLVRCVAADKSHVSTGIAGTLGYMAPEYLVRGQLTEKADVYAFGVLALEVATGKKNSVFSQGSNSTLYTVWKHYRRKTLTQAIDPGLNGKFLEEEALKVLQIGLLCTQTSVSQRPLMSEIVEMLTHDDYIVPSPTQPPFLNSSVLTPDDTTQTSTFMDSSDFEGQIRTYKDPKTNHVEGYEPR